MKNTIIIAVLIVLIIIMGLGSKHFFNQKSNYNSTIETYRDKLDHKVRVINTLESSVSEFNSASIKADSLRSEVEKDLVFAKRHIDALNIKVKNLKSFIRVNSIVKDSFTVHFDTVLIDFDTVMQAVYNDGYMNQSLTYQPINNTLDVNYSIIDTIIVVDSWIREPNKKGKQVFYLWRWIKPWQVKVEVKSKNPKSQITNGSRIVIK